ncbi:MAG: hypothetical protein M9939_26190 [Mesorhizobium sp.]|nr:hypothetical protein [Mesorhizobium sp.]MCO5164584.1 hypothetical protein [Mesorhizobium sp.]
MIFRAFTSAELTAEIRKYVPDFAIRYEPDIRKNIAAGWPNSIDDSAARSDWRWNQQYGLTETVEDMLRNIQSNPGAATKVSLGFKTGASA